MISAYDTVFSSIVVSDLELSESMLPFLVSSTSMTCILLLFSSGDFCKSLLFFISFKDVIGSSKSNGELDAENDSTELGVGTSMVTNLLGN